LQSQPSLPLTTTTNPSLDCRGKGAKRTFHLFLSSTFAEEVVSYVTRPVNRPQVGNQKETFVFLQARRACCGCCSGPRDSLNVSFIGNGHTDNTQRGITSLSRICRILFRSRGRKSSKRPVAGDSCPGKSMIFEHEGHSKMHAGAP